MIKKLSVLNSVSAVSFIISSISLLFIPLLKLNEVFPKTRNVIALFFWSGLLCGAFLQIYLALKCKRLRLRSKTKNNAFP